MKHLKIFILYFCKHIFLGSDMNYSKSELNDSSVIKNISYLKSNKTVDKGKISQKITHLTIRLFYQ